MHDSADNQEAASPVPRLTGVFQASTMLLVLCYGLYLPEVLAAHSWPVVFLLGLVGLVMLVTLVYFAQRRIRLQAWLTGLFCAGILLQLTLFTTDLYNESLEVTNRDHLRQLHLYLGLHAKEHGYRYPDSVDSASMSPEWGHCSTARYLGWKVSLPVVINSHLAGQSISMITKPDRTILLAIGRQADQRAFSALDEIDTRHIALVVFASGETATLTPAVIMRHLTGADIPEEQRWYIVPPKE